MRLFDTGFVAIQTTAIRRLTERSLEDPSKGVISLRRLVDDIRENRCLITREVYVGVDGLPYDSSAAKTRWMESIPLKVGQTQLWGLCPPQVPKHGEWLTSNMSSLTS